MSRLSPIPEEVQGMKLNGRLTKHKDIAHDLMIDTTFRKALTTLPPKPGFTEDDLKIKDIKKKLRLLKSDRKFKNIFRAFTSKRLNGHYDIPAISYDERVKLYAKWSDSGKVDDLPDETDFYIYKNNSQKLSHLEWSYNEYMAQKKEENESSGSKSSVAQRASSKRTKKKKKPTKKKKKKGKKKKKEKKKEKKREGGKKTKKKTSFFSGFHMS